MVLTCVDEGNTQRWTVYHTDGSSFDHSFTREQRPGTQYIRYPYQYSFTLSSNDFNHFVSFFSAMVTESLQVIKVKCAGRLPPDEFILRFAGYIMIGNSIIATVTVLFLAVSGVPLSPINVDSTVAKYYENYSTVLISWNSSTDDNRVDFYQYHLNRGIDSESLITYNTTNTSKILSHISYNENISFFLSATNCIGKSSPVIYAFEIGMCMINLLPTSYMVTMFC